MSSKQTNLRVFNASNLNMSTIRISSVDNSDWDGDSRPDENFNNVTINAFGIKSEREEINTSNSSAHFTMTITYSNGDVIQFRVDQFDATHKAGSLIDISADKDNVLNYAGYQYGDGTNLILVIFQNISSGTWMKQNWNNISSKQLCEVAIPGSHDAGMSVLNFSTSGSTSDNTQTQKYNIGDQLSKGSRYFDLRPMLWESKVKDSSFYTGHFSVINVIGTEGSLGQSLSDIFDEVRSFVTHSSNDHEIIVLKFSHYMDIDNNGANFNADQKTALKNFVLDSIGDLLYTSTNAHVNLGQVTLSSIQASGKRVIAIFDAMDSYAESSRGFFTFGNNSSTENYRLYDQYSNNDDFSTMANDQLNKFHNFTSSNGSMFLLSWTQTEGWTDYVDNSIHDLAKKADTYLWWGIYEMFSSGYATSTKIPNILYLDYFDSSYYFAEAAYFLNCYRNA
jgi:hypothetical protein